MSGLGPHIGACAILAAGVAVYLVGTVLNVLDSIDRALEAL